MARIKIDQPLRGSRTGKPVMALLDLLGRRWVLRILWELREGPMTFRELRSACADMSPSVLNQRVTELRDALILESGKDGYALTTRGTELTGFLVPLHAWAEDWAKTLRQRGSAGQVTK